MATPDKAGSSESSKRSSYDSDDDISMCTLKADLSEYLEKAESSGYHELYPGVERIEYDFTEERQNIYSTNLVESTAHLVKGCTGVGIMAIHVGFMYGGLWSSLAGAVVVGLLMCHTMSMVVRSAQKMYLRLRVSRLSYPDLVEAAVATGPLICCRQYSKGFRCFLEATLFIEYHGTCCIFNIMIATTLKKATEAISETANDLQLSIRIYILMIVLPLLALCLIRFKYLAIFSLAADIVTGICVVITVYYSIGMASDISVRPAWKSVHGLFHFFGICVYAMDGVGVALPIENHMARPQYFSVVIQCGMMFVISFVTIVGFFGYLAWGEDCESPITKHMSDDLMSILMQLFLIASLGVTFALHFWVPFRILWHYLGRKYKRKRHLWEKLYRTIHVITISCLSIAFPNMIKWMAFIGCFFMSFIVFLFPAVIEMLVTWKEPRFGYSRWILLKNMCIITFGIMLCSESFVKYSK